jgi:hypothetical protein
MLQRFCILLLICHLVLLFVEAASNFTYLNRNLYLTKPRVAVAGIAYNVYRHLPNVKHFLYKTLKDLEFECFIYENDSIDGTKLFLKKWAENDPRVKVKLDNGYKNTREYRSGMKIGYMTERFAQCRNHYLDHFKNGTFDVLWVIDMDVGSWDVDKARKALWETKLLGHGHVINGTLDGIPYDVLAFRDSKFPEYLKDMDEEDFWDLSRKAKIRSYMNTIFTKHQVFSAFGGMGFYPFDAAMKSNYSGYKDGVAQCEHIHFHESMNCFLYLLGDFRVEKGSHYYNDEGQITFGKSK